MIYTRYFKCPVRSSRYLLLLSILLRIRCIICVTLCLHVLGLMCSGPICGWANDAVPYYFHSHHCILDHTTVWQCCSSLMSEIWSRVLGLLSDLAVFSRLNACSSAVLYRAVFLHLCLEHIQSLLECLFGSQWCRHCWRPGNTESVFSDGRITV